MRGKHWKPLKWKFLGQSVFLRQLLYNQSDFFQVIMPFLQSHQFMFTMNQKISTFGAAVKDEDRLHQGDASRLQMEPGGIILCVR